MSRDPTSLEEIEWTLWCVLLCQCDRCGKILDLDEYERYQDEPMNWAKAAAPKVKSEGWATPAEFELHCDECTKP